MSIRVILIPLFGSDTDSVCLRAGLAVAQRFGAYAEGLFVRVDPADVIPPIGEGGLSPAAVIQLTQAVAEEMARRARRRGGHSRRPLRNRASRSPTTLARRRPRGAGSS